MRRFLTVSVCAALAIGLATAQGGPGGPGRPPGGRPGMRMGPGGGGRWLDQLNLTPAQKTKVDAIMKKQGEQMRAVFNSKMTDEQKRAKWKAISDANNKQIRALLTPAQQKKWDEMQKNRREMMGGMGPRGGGMTADLGLTPAQKSKVDGIMKRTGDQMRAIRESKATEEQKRAKMKALWDASNKQVRALLTPAQQKKWDAHMRPRIAD